MPSYVVTGASRGLGYAWITHLASLSSNTVIAIVRNKSATEARLSKDGITNIHVLSADVTDIAAVQAAADATATITGGGLDILIHNAALVSERSAFKTPLEMPPQEFEDDLMESFKANVVGASHVLSSFLPLIRKGNVKKMIVTSTGMADEGLVTGFDVAVAAPYSISKAAVNMLVAKYHATVGRSEGILVLAMSPGYVDTSEGKSTSEEDLKVAQAMGAKFAKFAPHFTGPTSPSQSVEDQLKVIERATVEEFGGQFVSHFGNKRWL
ncbi:related to protoporphyrinogen oxidase [Ramularia collo-cygni]|uniref:Related to protoporphyrinogen oxidase n=1 Tax=Ramularia collo-cygni TaxID=112498 RepID=A0A2D3V5C3_9PEZI|nr:related to protoporphyrinogen oxidase [Ramularia collo-cygni]CZT20650.1 related to protoporphyrinogen oxidase [Ramularia collo-cygni]